MCGSFHNKWKITFKVGITLASSARKKNPSSKSASTSINSCQLTASLRGGMNPTNQSASRTLIPDSVLRKASITSNQENKYQRGFARWRKKYVRCSMRRTPLATSTSIFFEIINWCIVDFSSINDGLRWLVFNKNRRKYRCAIWEDSSSRILPLPLPRDK